MQALPHRGRRQERFLARTFTSADLLRFYRFRLIPLKWQRRFDRARIESTVILIAA